MMNLIRSRRWRRRSAAAAALSIAVAFSSGPEASGTVTTVGAVTPTPPAAGGPVAGALVIGEADYGSVTVTAGTGITAGGTTILGNGISGIGYLSLSGYGSNFGLTSASFDLLIGDEGAGSVSVSNTAKVVVPDDTNLGVQSTGRGELAVTGLGTIYTTISDMTVGVSGSGAVEVTSGGSMVVSDLTLGDNATADGSALVSGDFAHLRADGVAVGDAGSGRLAVTDGGRFTALTVTIVAVQANSYGTLIVDGAGSLFQLTGALSTGQGDGNITVSNGGTLTTTAASQISATGRVTLAGGRWASNVASPSAIAVAGLLQGSGTLDVQGVAVGGGSPAGRLQTKTGDRLLLTGQLSNAGLVDLAGGELEVRGAFSNSGDVDARNGATLRVGGSGLANASGSQLAITGGAVDVFGAVTNSTGAEIAVVGGATGVFHDAVTNNGKIFVSASSEIVMLENLSFVPSSSLSVQVASIEAPNESSDSFGMVSVGGASTLAGTLAVTLAPGFAPAAGEKYTILTAANGLSGTFATESLPTLGGGLSFDIEYTPTSVMLAVVGGTFLSADFDKDGDVDAQDLATWKGAFGTSPQGDANGDEKTDGADFLIWQGQFGMTPATAASNAASAAVPEPTTAALLLGASLALRGNRRRSSTG